MTTTPPEQPSEPTGPAGGDTESGAVRPGGMTTAANFDLARLPVPGNAEFLVYLAVELIFALIWAFTDEVTASDWVTLTTALTFAYLISRGIAKASRVLEH